MWAHGWAAARGRRALAPSLCVCAALLARAHSYLDVCIPEYTCVCAGTRVQVSSLVAEGVTSAEDFGWQAQLRAYWAQTDVREPPARMRVRGLQTLHTVACQHAYTRLCACGSAGRAGGKPAGPRVDRPSVHDERGLGVRLRVPGQQQPPGHYAADGPVGPAAQYESLADAARNGSKRLTCRSSAAGC
jgi:hypothetical protein